MCKRIFIGIDIQIRRNCCYAVLNDNGSLIESGWFLITEAGAVDLVKRLSGSGQVAVGIDAPRMPLISKRRWYWSGNRQRWEERVYQRGYGRHCEIIISAHRIANPQWTPLKAEAPEWMQLGFRLYKALEGLSTVHEVFPTASYTLLQGNTDVRIDADFSACAPGPKDMLDAWVAAATMREFEEGRGAEVGGGDGLGTIILPRPLPEPINEEVLALQRYLVYFQFEILSKACHTTQQSIKNGGRPCYPIRDATNTCIRFQSSTSTRAMSKVS